ncbi:MAG: hypothetical protein AMXMBFR33_30200 [Candidatus Xenobia bacterium]
MNVVHPGHSGRLIKVAEGHIGSARISGDGSTVVWNQMVDGQLEVMRWQDGRVDCLSKDDRADMHPDVSYDGRTVVWTRYSNPDPRGEGSWDVVMWKDGEKTEIGCDPKGNELSPRISRDGQVVVWDNDQTGSYGPCRIERWKDGEVERVTEGAEGTSQEFPILSGDGSRIFWREFAAGNSDIWMRDQHGVIKPVVSTESDQVTPQVTPDGCKLVWTDNAKGDEDIYFSNLDYGNQVEIVSGQRLADETWASMSADASVIAWTNFDRADDSVSRVNIFLKQGGDVQQVTVEDGGLNTNPRLSDAGDKLVWHWLDNQDSQHSVLYLLEREQPAPAP